MPKELLPTVITVMCGRLLNAQSDKTEHYAMLVSFQSFDSDSCIHELMVVLHVPYKSAHTG
jgi:hypothetical protein